MINKTPSAYVVGAYEHPTRRADGMSLAQLHVEVAMGALEDAGLRARDIDAYFCASDAPGVGVFGMAEYLGMNLRYMESTETGGSSYLLHVRHAAHAISSGLCDIALITMADNSVATGAGLRLGGVDTLMEMPNAQFEMPYVQGAAGLYALVARRHMYEFGTTPEQFAWVKVAMSHHAQHNPHAFYRNVVTVEEVLASPLIADPLHRLDCCVMTDGGGALIVARPEIARSLKRPLVPILGMGEAIKHNGGGKVDLTHSAGVQSGRMAFEQAGIRPADVGYASLYDSFTVTVVIQIEDLGFCAKGAGGAFVADGKLISGIGPLAVNTDGGGLCSNHPGNRGGMTKLLEAVRQARGEANAAVQVKDLDFAVAHGTGGALNATHVAGTVIFGRE